MPLGLAILLSFIPFMSRAQDSSRLEQIIAATWAPHEVTCRWEPIFGDPGVLSSWQEIEPQSGLHESAHDMLIIALSGVDQNGKEAQLTLKGNARIFGSGWTVRDRVRQGSQIKKEQLSQIECEWSALRDIALLDAQAIIGKYAVRPLIPGRAILASDVRHRALIKSGDPVVIHYEQGGVLVKVEGVAMKDGGVGEKIPVRVPEVAQNRLEGVIQDDATLRWVP